MTTDQWLTVLSLVVWPITALIAGTAFVHGVRLLLDGLSGLQTEFFAARRTERGNSLSNAFLVMRESIPDMARACAYAICEEVDAERGVTGERRTAESGLLAMLQARGGLPIPAPNGDPAVRQLVREVRKMYDELDNPTPEPAKGAYQEPDGDDLDPDDRILQELFGGGVAAGGEAEPVDLPEEDI